MGMDDVEMELPPSKSGRRKAIRMIEKQKARAKKQKNPQSGSKANDPTKKVEAKKEEEKKSDQPKYLGGRKLKAAMRMANRQEKVAIVKAARRSFTLTPKQELLLWFQQRVGLDCKGPGATKQSYSYAEACDIVQEYLGLFVEEMAELKEKMQGTRQYHARPATAAGLKTQMLLSRRIAEHSRQFSGPGFEAPDITSPEVVLSLLEWDQLSKSMQDFPFALFRASKTPHDGVASSSPPSSSSSIASSSSN